MEKKIGEIKEELKAAEDTMLPCFIETYEKDERAQWIIDRNQLMELIKTEMEGTGKNPS